MSQKVLAIDVGNSETKIGTVDGGVVSSVSRFPTRQIESAINEILTADCPIALCSVKKHASETIITALEKSGRQLALQVDCKVKSPVSGFYAGMGADRVAELAAAWVDFAGARPVAVVGLGTATTIASASKSGEFKGGFITMGLGATCSTLTDALPELPPVDPNQAKTLAPAFDTYSSICHGTVAGHIGMIEKWISIFREELGSEMAVVATGGWSHLLEPWCPFLDKVDPVLSLRGIWAIHKESLL